MEKNIAEQIRQLELMYEFHKYMDNWVIAQAIQDLINDLKQKWIK